MTASRAVSGSTVIRLTTRPSARCSSDQRTYAGWTRYIVEQGQITGSRQNTRLSGSSASSRLTRLISVPTAQVVPAGAARTVSMMYSVEPSQSAACTTSSRRSEEHTSELQSRQYLVCRLLLEKKKEHGEIISR